MLLLPRIADAQYIGGNVIDGAGRLAFQRLVARGCSFSDEVEALYQASARKEPEDDYDRRWYDLFRPEWASLRASAPCAT